MPESDMATMFEDNQGPTDPVFICGQNTLISNITTSNHEFEVVSNGKYGGRNFDLALAKIVLFRQQTDI